jgi:hypothetical protein
MGAVEGAAAPFAARGARAVDDVAELHAPIMTKGCDGAIAPPRPGRGPHVPAGGAYRFSSDETGDIGRTVSA